MTRSRDVADTQDNVGGAVAPFVAGKNKIINGNFGIWQRGTSYDFSPGTGYTSDRFIVTSSGNTGTVTQQSFAVGAAPVTGYEAQFFARANVVGVAGASNFTTYGQRIEDVRTFAGQTVTISYWAKADAVKSVSVELQQFFGSGGSANVNTFVTKQALTTSWVRYTSTIAVPSISGKTIGTGATQLDIRFWLSAGSTFDSRTSTLGTQSITFDIWGVQVEAGSVATPFTTASGSIGGELALCQRYYYNAVTGNSQYLGSASFYTASEADTMLNFPVTMRIAPTLVATSGTNYYATNRNGASSTYNSLTIYQPSTNGAMMYNTSASGTGGFAGTTYTNNAAASVAFSAEL